MAFAFQLLAKLVVSQKVLRLLLAVATHSAASTNIKHLLPNNIQQGAHKASKTKCHKIRLDYLNKLDYDDIEAFRAAQAGLKLIAASTE